MEEMKIHDGCTDCIHEPKGFADFPCRSCKGTTTSDSNEYRTRQDFWTCVPEAVEHPSHYNQGSIECIDAMISAFGTENTALWCKINAFKYLWRSDYKNGMEDLKKASWYINKTIELIESDGESN